MIQEDEKKRSSTPKTITPALTHAWRRIKIDKTAEWNNAANSLHGQTLVYMEGIASYREMYNYSLAKQ